MAISAERSINIERDQMQIIRRLAKDSDEALISRLVSPFPSGIGDREAL